MAIGAPGGNVILSACLQIFLNVAEFDMRAVEAVSAPRIHAEGSMIWHEASIRQDVNKLNSRSRGTTKWHVYVILY